MFEEFEESALCTPRNQFDRQEFYQELYDARISKILYRSSTPGSKAVKRERVEKFKQKYTVESYGDMLWEQMVADNQIIPQEFWYPRKFFTEGSALARLNPHFFVTFYEAVNRYTPKGDTLVLLHCKEEKPYKNDQAVGMYTKFAEQFGYDVAVMSATITPIYPFDASTQYPFFVYNWPDNRKGQYDELVAQWLVSQIGYMIARHKYKRVILISSGGPHYDKPFVEAKKQFTDVEFIHIGENTGAAKKLLTVKFKHKGVASVRLPISVWGRMCLLSLFDEDPDVHLKDSINYHQIRDDMLALANKYYPGKNVTLKNLKEFITEHQYEGTEKLPDPGDS